MMVSNYEETTSTKTSFFEKVLNLTLSFLGDALSCFHFDTEESLYPLVVNYPQTDLDKLWSTSKIHLLCGSCYLPSSNKKI